MAKSEDYKDIPLGLWAYVQWQKGHDGLFGAYQWRLRSTRGTCFGCGRTIKGLCYEKSRGGTTWLVCSGKRCSDIGLLKDE